MACPCLLETPQKLAIGDETHGAANGAGLDLAAQPSPLPTPRAQAEIRLQAMSKIAAQAK